MSVPTNLIPTLITGLQEYTGSSTLGYMPYILDGRTYKVQFANIAAVGAVPSSRVIAAGTGLAGGGDLSANRVISIANGGVGFDQLALSGVTQGTYGSGSAIPILTVDSKGRITSATTAPLDVTGFVPTSRTITAGDGLTGGGALTSNVTLAANFSAATPSALGTASAGTAITVSRGDHVHPAVNLSDTSQTQGALPLGRGGTGDALSPVAGAVVYSTGSKFALTNPGIAGQVLVSAGTDEPQWQTILGTGTVTSVSVSTANGFAGFVANPATVPDITLSTTVTGMLKGDGTGMSAATAGVDYVEPGPYTTSGLTMASARLLGRTTASVGAAQEITVGTGLTLSSGSLVNAAPDQTVSLTAGTAISVTGTYPSFTVTNTAPDQVVSLTGAGTTTVTGTYPSFTITSNDSTSGTVTSVNASGGTTGMSFTGGPVTSAGTLTLNGTLAVANGGTGATDAATALTNLGAYPASNPAGYTTNVGTVTSVSGTGTVSGLSLSGTVTSAGSLTLGGTLAVTPSDFASQTANTVLAAPNGSAGVPTFRNLVAADVPTLNQNTTGTASNVTGIVAVANGGTGASVAGTARTNLGAAASGANTDITSIALTTGTISTSPVNGTDIVNKAYADSIASGINFHQSVRLATAAALPANTYNNGTSGVGATLTANANGALSVDGVAVAVGNRILVKNEAAQANNGVYVVTDTGSSGGPGPGPGGSNPYILTRATDFDSSGSGVDQIDAGDFFLVTAGSTLANTSWVQQTPLPITVGTTAIVFSQFAAPVLYSAGTGLSLAGTTFSITDTGVSASTYGSASSVPVLAINAQGQVTSASSSSIAIAASQITSGALAIANGGTGATSAATALTNLGAYPASNPAGYTSNTGTVTSVNLTAGTGISVSGGPITASGSITVVNTAPDQVVSLTGSGATTVTGTYPNFTISSPASGAGTVTSIDVSGGTTGLTTSGGPVTSSGTITLAGTLNVANGGTGATTLSSGYVLKGNGTSAVSASVIYDNGTNVGIGTTSVSGTYGKLTVAGGVQTTDDANSKLELGRYSAGAPNSYIKLGPNSTSLRFTNAADDADLLTLTNAGNLGLGNASIPYTASGRTVFNVNGTSSTIMSLQTAGSNRGYLYADGSLISLETESGATLRLLTNAAQPILLYTNGAERLSINSSGNVTANVDMRAPIFYDSDNTSYYLDPASNSTSMRTNGAWITNPTSTWGGDVAGKLEYHNNRWYASVNTAFVVRSTTGSEVFWAYNTGVVEASNDFRAPIFYDSNDTTYYLDPAGGSNLYTTKFNTATNGAAGRTIAIKDATQSEILFGAYPGGWTSALQIQNNDNSDFFWISPLDVNNNARIRTGGCGLDFYTDGGNDTGTYSLFVGSGYATGQSSLRAPIFYDSDNTAYYLDPSAGTSLNAAGNLVYGTGGANTGSFIYHGGGSGDYGVVRFYQAGSNNSTIHAFSTAWQGGTLQSSAAGSINLSGANGVTFGPWYDVQMWVDNTGIAQARASMRAPLFYDSDNTSYYVDPNNTSVLNNVLTVGAVSNNVGGLRNVNPGGGSYVTSTSTVSGAIKIKLPETSYPMLRFTVRVYTYDGLSFDIYCGGHTSSALWYNTFAYMTTQNRPALNVRFTGDGTNMYVIIGELAQTWTYPQVFITDVQVGYTNYDASRWDDGWVISFETSTYHTVGSTHQVFPPTSSTNNVNPAYASIYYDANNTGYYLDPNSTSNLVTIYANKTAANNTPAIQVRGGNPGYPRIQTYGLDADANAWMGLGTDMAGGPYEHSVYFPNGSGAGRLSIGDYNGTTYNPRLWVYPTYTQINNSTRSPIFYDSDNTGFYLDPASTGTSLNVAGNIIGVGELRTSGQITNANYMVGGSQNGAVNIGRNDLNYRWEGTNWGSTTTLGLLANCLDYWEFGIHDSGSKVVSPLYYDGGARFLMGRDIGWGQTYVEAASSFRAPVFYDSDNTGYYVDPTSTSFLLNLNLNGSLTAAGAITVGNGAAASYIYMKDVDEGDRIIHCNSNRIGFLTQGGGWGSWCDDSGYWLSEYSVRGPVFYDSNNTSYYLDPAGTSVLNYVGVQQGNGVNFNGAGSTVIKGTSGDGANSTTANLKIQSWFGIGFGPTISGQPIPIDENAVFIDCRSGDLTARGNVTAYSDIRVKKDVETIEGALDLVSKMRGVRYTRIDSGWRGVGVIAQEVLEVVPEVVQREDNENGALSVAYGNLVGVLIEAIKELTARVAELEGK